MVSFINARDQRITQVDYTKDHNPLISSWTSTPTVGTGSQSAGARGAGQPCLNNQLYSVPSARFNRYPNAFEAKRSVGRCTSGLGGHRGESHDTLSQALENSTNWCLASR